MKRRNERHEKISFSKGQGGGEDLTNNIFLLKEKKTYNPTGSPRICMVDCGLKMNQVWDIFNFLSSLFKRFVFL